jgi:hypothetical protein
MPVYRNGKPMEATKLRAEYIDRNLAEAKKIADQAHRFRKAYKKTKDADAASDHHLFISGFLAGEAWSQHGKDAAWQKGYAKGMLVERMRRQEAKVDEKGWLLARLKAVRAESYAEGFKVGRAAGSRDASIHIKLRMDHADCQSIIDEVMRETGMGKRKRPYAKPVLRKKRITKASERPWGWRKLLASAKGGRKARKPAKAGPRPRKAGKGRPNWRKAVVTGYDDE